MLLNNFCKLCMERTLYCFRRKRTSSKSSVPDLASFPAAGLGFPLPLLLPSCACCCGSSQTRGRRGYNAAARSATSLSATVTGLLSIPPKSTTLFPAFGMQLAAAAVGKSS